MTRTMLDIITKEQLDDLNSNGYSVVHTDILTNAVNTIDSLAHAQDETLENDQIDRNCNALIELCQDQGLHMKIPGIADDEDEVLFTAPSGKELRIKVGHHLSNEALSQVRELMK